MRALAIFALLPVVIGAAAARAQPPASGPRVVIPFDFESKFDDGRYGRMLGDMVWQKLERQGGFLLPESMLDVRDVCRARGARLSPATPLADVQKLVREDFDGQIAIWGKVERVEGFGEDVYDLWIHVADVAGNEPRLLHQSKSRTKTVSEIPHLYVKAALDELSQRVAAPPKIDLAARERLWRENANLVRGDFEHGAKSPTGWDALPRHAALVALPADGSSQQPRAPTNRVVRFSFGEDVAGSTGVLYYSDFFPVEAHAVYRFQCRYRTTGSAVKVFVKCYGEFATKYAPDGPASEEPKARPPASREPDLSRGQSSSHERREVYRSQQNLAGGTKEWQTHTEDFTPKHDKFEPRWGRVMLYAYWPAGAVDWDDVVVKQIAPPPNK